MLIGFKATFLTQAALLCSYWVFGAEICFSGTKWQRIMNTLKTLGFELYVPELSLPNDEQKQPFQCPFSRVSEQGKHLGRE